VCGLTVLLRYNGSGPGNPSQDHLPGKDMNFCLHHVVHTSSGVSYSGSDLEADHLSPSSWRGKKAWRCTSASPCIFVAWCVANHRDSFVLQCRESWAIRKSKTRYSLPKLNFLRSGQGYKEADGLENVIHMVKLQRNARERIPWFATKCYPKDWREWEGPRMIRGGVRRTCSTNDLWWMNWKSS
jgi:hypothetical protein